MAVDKLVDSTQLDADLTSVANAIRAKGGTSASLVFPSGFVSAVQAIPTGITPTGTKQISITQNGTTTEDVTNYADAEITVNVSGGGGSGIPLLDVITVTENVRAVNLDLTPYHSCDEVLIFSDVTLSETDWLYIVVNGSSPSGGQYTNASLSTHKGLFGVMGILAGQLDANKQKTGHVASTSPMLWSSGYANNLYIYTYNASKTILAGSKFYIYGGTYADILQ